MPVAIIDENSQMIDKCRRDCRVTDQNLQCVILNILWEFRNWLLVISGSRIYNVLFLDILL